MNKRTRSEVSASALKESIDLSLVAESASSNRAHTKSNVDHSKTRSDAPVFPKLSGAALERALLLARRLASSHAD